MPLRDVITIDESLCDGCGDCVTSCAEGALRVIDGKARLVSEVYCDGLGACLGYCPQGAITVVRREAPPYDEAAVARHLVRSPVSFLPMARESGSACPGSRPMSLPVAASAPSSAQALHGTTSQLRHWPVQLHLVSPMAAAFDGADVLLAADCVAFAHPSFHDTLLAGRSLAVACPKLDSHQDVYVEKLVAMIDRAGVRSLTVAVMEVPCCGGLIRLVQAAAERAARKPPMRAVVVGVGGEILGERSL